ncbi:S9 family peptidase [Enhygromyxa salina]|uniref:Prolyl tripeptidyl peptidase n=1 Tax=Enhygromyxa salina TaxID=215803 RepID=A0A2S9YRD2_9BACT|nr:S9 family peptidase [Enhygromyxa salina]PRQ07646.1 Prolyl tripeptidyl peptidase precursor [Enhygromyxa salina]
MAASSPITLEDIATYPHPGTATPGSLRFSPDGQWLTWLDSADDSLSRELFALELEQAATAELRRVVEPPDGGVREDNLSPEEKLARERMRVRALGVTQYAWATRANRLLLPLTGEIWVQDGIDAPLHKLVGKSEADPRPALNPSLSPDGEQIAFVRGNELWVVPADGSAPPRQVTSGIDKGKTRGLAEYIAAEEMGRHAGYWWAPDGGSIAFVEVDETHIPAYRIVHQGKDAVGDAAQEDHGYPFAGADNARVRLGVVASKGGAVRWLPLDQADWVERGGPWTGDPARDLYLARVDWTPDGSLCVQVEDRRQQELRLLRFAGAKGPATTLLSERSDVWINLHDMFEPLELDEATAAAHPEQVGGFVWASERSGFRHLYLHAADGTELAQLTSGEWMVEGITEIDEASQKLWFSATKDDPREHHYFEVGLDGQGLRKLTEAPGMHHLVIDRGHRYYVDVHSSEAAPPTVTLHQLSDGAPLRTLHPASPADVDPRVAKLELEPPRFVELTAADGQTTLYGAIYQPDPSVHGPGPYPTVVSVYGGPHAQRVSRSWGMTVDLRAQYLRDHGYLVFKLDNRGSSRRGLAFEGALRHDMGNVEIQDQVAGVEWLVGEGLTDPKRVAIYGWSYGGYMAAMALARAPQTFQVGIAGAPVTHWDGYDTHYTERYMGLPQENPEGYARSSVMAHVAELSGSLLLVHGLIDENVHFRHTARLINALIAAGKSYELQLYPDERHMPRKLEDRVYMERRIFEFLTKHL